jgi:hypothetical protein
MIMSVQKNITLHVNHPKENTWSDCAAITSPKDCNIHIQVASGWAITGHYRNQTLQTITLEKSLSKESSHHG